MKMYERFYDANNLTLSGYVDLLLEATDENDVLSIPRFDEVWPSDKPACMECIQMSWTKEDGPALLAEVEKRVNTIRELARLKKEYGEELGEWLSDHEDYRCFVDKYLASLFDNEEAEDKFLELEERIDAGDKLTDEELEFYETIGDARFVKAKERIGGAEYNFHVIICSQRLFRLFELEAPTVVLENEMKAFAEAVAINIYGLAIQYTAPFLSH